MKKMLLLMIMLMLVPFEMVGAYIVPSATVEVTPTQLTPGSDGYIKFTIKNSGTEDLPLIYVQLVSLDKPLSADVNDLKSSYIGGIKAGGTTEKIYKFTAPPGTPSGIYAARYTVSQLVQTESEVTISGYVLIPVQAPSTLIVRSISPSSFRPGEKTLMNITLSNNGGAMLNDLVVSWETPGDLMLPLGSDSKISILSMEPEEEVVLPVEVVVSPDATPGVYPFLVKTKYHDQTSSEKTTNSTIGIVIERLAGTDINVRFSPSSFSPGEKADIIFDITNMGDSDLSDISLSWSVKDDVILPLGLGNTMSVKSLNAGERIQIPVEIIVDSEVLPAIYPLSIKATYSDDKGIQKTDNLTMGVLIGGPTDFQVGLQEVSGRTTSLSIGNIGVNPASAITVTIPLQEGFSISGSSEVFVGNLDPGDFTVAGFQLAQKQGGGTLQVQVAYTDASGNRQTIEKDLAPNDAISRAASTGEMARDQGFMPHNSSQSGLKNILIGAAGIFVIAVLFLIWRRKK